MAVALVPSTILAQSGESGIAAETQRSIFSFTRIGQRAKRNGDTQILQGAAQVWRMDNHREGRKNADYWSVFRSRDEERIAAARRAEMNRELQSIKARAAAYQSFATQSGSAQGARTEDATSRFFEFPGNRTRSSPPSLLSLDPDKPGTKSVGETKDPITKIADAIDETFKPDRSSETPRRASVALALLAVILVPSFAGFLLFAGFLSARHGHLLRGVVIGAAGLGLVLLLYVTAFHREKFPDRQKLLIECRHASITITASVLELDEDGAVLASLSTKGGKIAETDGNGYAFLFTSKSDSISGGESFTRVVYPVGQKRTYNALGLGADMPAYTDSLEQAIAHREQKSLEANWWQRLMRPLVEG